MYDAKSFLLSMLVTFLVLVFFVASVLGTIRLRARPIQPPVRQAREDKGFELEPCRTIAIMMPCGRIMAGKPPSEPVTP